MNTLRILLCKLIHINLLLFLIFIIVMDSTLYTLVFIVVQSTLKTNRTFLSVTTLLIAHIDRDSIRTNGFIQVILIEQLIFDINAFIVGCLSFHFLDSIDHLLLFHHLLLMLLSKFLLRYFNFASLECCFINSFYQVFNQFHLVDSISFLE